MAPRKTKEELDAEAAAAAKAAEEALAQPSASPAIPTPSPSPQIENSSASPSPAGASPSASPAIPSPSPEVPPKKKEEPKKGDPDYKEKFSASSREAQKLLAKNRKINNAIDDASALPEPTDEEMKAEYPELEDMTPTERSLAKETLISKRWRQAIAKGRQEASKIEKWGEEVDAFVDDPKTLIDNPDLEGKVEEFKAYANDESHNSIPFPILVSAFLHEQSKSKKTPSKGKMFEDGSGGPIEKNRNNNGMVSVEESIRIRDTDFPRYKQLVKDKKIDYSTIS